MKKFNKIMSLLLAVVMVASLFAGCGNKTADETKPSETAPTAGNDGPVMAADAQTEIDPEVYDADSSEIYDGVLGEFYEYYSNALAEKLDLDVRMALMALADAKLAESAVIIPTSSQGGNYSMSRVVPNTVTTTDWGMDEYRYNDILITNEFIKSEDRVALKAMFNELMGTGTYSAEAKKYLTDKGYTFKDTYDKSYTTDPSTWDPLSSSRTVDGEPSALLIEGLLRYNNENSQGYAQADSYTVSDDGLTYTFHIREGNKWVDFQGRELDDVQADDWVAGLQHAVDTQSGLGDLLAGVVVNLDGYIKGEITDFSEVGVKAVDKYTLEYTLETPTAWFITLTGYSALAPLCRSYYESQGGKFGDEFDSSASDYTFGTDPEHIAYNGAFLVSNYTSHNIISFVANPSYWDAANVTVKGVNWKYNDSTDPTKDYNDAKAGTIDGAGLSASVLESAKIETPDGEDGTYFDLYHYNARTDATSFNAFFNVNRHAFSNANDASAVVSTQTVDDAERTSAAVKNVHFRRAVTMGLDRGAYMAPVLGEELKYARVINSYVPGTFQFLSKDVTVDINGTATTFPAGTYFGEIEQAQIDADGVKIKVWDPETQSSSQFDGWYNPANAQEELAIAVEELAAQGVEVSAENPIKIEYPYYSSSPVMSSRANVVKQSIEASTNGFVEIVLVDTVDTDTYQAANYDADYGYDCNYDFCDASGWSPDYGDAQTYLDTFLPNYSGYMTRTLGIF